MKVLDLIKELKKYPPNALVAIRDHDQCEGEISAHVNSVSAWTEYDDEQCMDKKFTKGVGVILSA